MEIAKIQVSGVIAQAVSLQNIPAGIIGAEVAFEYIDPMWDALTKTVVFKGCCTMVFVNAGDTVIIPAEVVAKPGVRVHVGVYGVDAAGTIAIPTLWATLGITRAAADPSGDESTDPVLPVWAQIQAVIGDLDELNTESKETLVAAINEALTKGGGTVDEVTVQKIVAEYLTEYPSGQGADGGYYTPTVNQPDEETMEISYTPSNEKMPAVEPVQIKLPVPDSTQNATGFSRTLCVALYNLLMDSVYQSSGHESDKAALEELLTGESGGDDSGESGETVVYYTIEKTLSNASISNGAATVQAGTAYSATLTADEGYTLDEVTVTMGGQAVTVTDGVIDITSVTGNIVITATTTADETGGYEWTSGTPYELTWTSGLTLSSTGEEATSDAGQVSDYANCFDVDYISYNKGTATFHFFDINKTRIGGGYQNSAPAAVKVPENAVYFRVCGNTSYINGVTVIPITKTTETFVSGVQELEWVSGKYNSSGEISSASNKSSGLFCINGATTITCGDSANATFMVFYDEHKNFVASASAKATPFDISVLPYCAYSYMAVSVYLGSETVTLA